MCVQCDVNYKSHETVENKRINLLLKWQHYTIANARNFQLAPNVDVNKVKIREAGLNLSTMNEVYCTDTDTDTGILYRYACNMLNNGH